VLVAPGSIAIGLPVRFVAIPSHSDAPCPMARSGPGADFPPNDVYGRTILDAYGRLKGAGAFSDIHLADLRAYRDGLLAHAGLEGVYPLWGRDGAELYAEFLALGFRALTADFVASLPAGADACGERGEYHSFVFAGPSFRRPVAVERGPIHRRPPFAFRERLPA
jgi:diphthamide synthase (EF-2-diphthine--ammonia ligase)